MAFRACWRLGSLLAFVFSPALQVDSRPADGRPNNTDDGKLFSESAAANPGGRVKVHTVLVGKDPDAESVQLMKKLASLHGGQYKNAQ